MCKTTNNYHHTVLFWRCTKNERLVKKKKKEIRLYSVWVAEKGSTENNRQGQVGIPATCPATLWSPPFSLSSIIFTLSLDFLTLKP